MTSYQHQLRGHVEELKWQVSSMEKSALKSGKDLPTYIQKFIHQEDPDFASEGKRMQMVTRRWERLSAHLTRLENSSVLTKPFFFLFAFDISIARSTLATFTPGICLSLEGALYGFLGMLMGWLLFHALKYSSRKLAS